MTTEWPAHPVVNFFLNDNRMECHPILIMTIVVFKFFIKMQEELIPLEMANGEQFSHGMAYQHNEKITPF